LKSKFLEPAFLTELAARTQYFGFPLLFHSKDKNILSSDLPESDGLVSFLYLYRYLKLAVQRGDAPPPEPGPFFARVEALASAFLLDMLRSGDPEPLRRLAGKLKLIEKHLSGVNWHFAVGTCASALLANGILPTKKLLRDLVEVIARRKGIKAPTLRHQARIRADLGLTGLPAASTRPRRARYQTSLLQ
jgi:hypothetical protein